MAGRQRSGLKPAQRLGLGVDGNDAPAATQHLDHIAAVAGTEQLWTTGGWHAKFALPLPASDTGYGHSSAEVAAVQVTSASLLLGYYDAVHARTLAFLATVAPADLDRIVDTRFDPPVTLGVRLVSIVDDCLEHVGQAAYVRGLAERALS